MEEFIAPVVVPVLVTTRVAELHWIYWELIVAPTLWTLDGCIPLPWKFPVIRILEVRIMIVWALAVVPEQPPDLRTNLATIIITTTISSSMEMVVQLTLQMWQVPVKALLNTTERCIVVVEAVVQAQPVLLAHITII